MATSPNFVDRFLSNCTCMLVHDTVRQCDMNYVHNKDAHKQLARLSSRGPNLHEGMSLSIPLQFNFVVVEKFQLLFNHKCPLSCAHDFNSRSQSQVKD